jgi:hypothetical protein
MLRPSRPLVSKLIDYRAVPAILPWFYASALPLLYAHASPFHFYKIDESGPT